MNMVMCVFRVEQKGVMSHTAVFICKKWRVIVIAVIKVGLVLCG